MTALTPLRKKSWTIAALSLVLFIILTLWVQARGLSTALPAIDPALQYWGSHMQTVTAMAGMSRFFAVAMGEHIGFFVVLGIAILLLLLKRFAATLFFLVNVGLAVGSTHVLKILISRTRPTIYRMSDFIDQSGYSFPSGHSSFATAIFGSLLVLAFLYVKQTGQRLLISIMVSLLILATMLSRIIVGVHYPSDTLAGFLLGLFFIAGTTPLLYQQHRKRI